MQFDLRKFIVSGTKPYAMQSFSVICLQRILPVQGSSSL